MGLDMYLKKIKKNGINMTQDDLNNIIEINNDFSSVKFNKKEFIELQKRKLAFLKLSVDDKLKLKDDDYYNVDYFKDMYEAQLKLNTTSKEKPVCEEVKKIAENVVNSYCKELIDRIRVINDNFEKYFKNIDSFEISDLCYWRKHPDLHGYMEYIYNERSGKENEEDFNCIPLILSKEDIQEIIEQHKERLNPDGSTLFEETSGFFFGSSCKQDFEESLKDFEKVLKEVDFDEYAVYYFSWW